ncbi:MAG: L-serine ammonia-lyase, iron-sulfur-dependent, subunit alpha [Clostridiales bacterium]|nr:L-serine ammonia-lyase, iron-sulfur-dependent, subunit alpha [Clostridiales bacterium]
MERLTELIRADMVPALGVTEPGAIAFAAAKARTLIGGGLRHLTVSMNSGLYKNAYSCGIPGAGETGAVFAAALGYAAGDPEKGLESLSGITESDLEMARRIVGCGRVTAEMTGISRRIALKARLETDQGTAEVEIRDRHTHIVRMSVNGRDPEPCGESTGKAEEPEEPEETGWIRRLTLQEILRYVNTVPAEEIGFIREAYRVNMELLEEGLRSGRTVFIPHLLNQNGNVVFSDDERRTASLLCNGAIEARVTGRNRLAMSITGSGAHGIMAKMPLYAVQKIRKLPEETLLRATALSFLICMYIKAYSGRLSALCGCALAGGTGAACELCLMGGGDEAAVGRVISNMASGLTGMICDGGNQGCVMKGIAACDAAFAAAELALDGVCVDSVHGINGRTPEETMRNIGWIASPGMTETERTIVGIQAEKAKR